VGFSDHASFGHEGRERKEKSVDAHAEPNLVHAAACTVSGRPTECFAKSFAKFARVSAPTTGRMRGTLDGFQPFSARYKDGTRRIVSLRFLTGSYKAFAFTAVTRVQIPSGTPTK
jgi:hypothetical protein